LTLEFQNAAILRVSSSQYFEEGGFTGPILAQQRMNFAGIHRERDLLQGSHAQEALADVSRLEERHLV
jgi:hypothetical protein